MKLKSLCVCLLLAFAANPLPLRADEGRDRSQATQRTQAATPAELRAAADLRLSSEWLARSYEIPERVPQEMLLAGYDYADVLVALALMEKGASLNELLTLRQSLLWPEVARRVELDPQDLPSPVRSLLSLGSPGVISTPPHFLPDVYAGLTHDLSVNAFSPTEPSKALVARYRLSETEVRNIRAALADPFGVPESLLLKTGGKSGLLVGDWVLAGVVAHFKPFSMDTVIAARMGEQLSWSELCLAYGLRPDVLTQGPLSGIYPVLTGHSPNTVLVARKRHDFPDVRPQYQSLQQLTEAEKTALLLLRNRCYQVSPAEQALLADRVPDLGEQSITIKVSRLGRLSLERVLDRHHAGESWSAILTTDRIDMTGQESLLAAINVREAVPPRLPPTTESRAATTGSLLP